MYFLFLFFIWNKKESDLHKYCYCLGFEETYVKTWEFSFGPVCLLENSFFLESKFQGKWIPRKYFLMFSSVMENKLENTFQCLVMSWKMNLKITY